MSESENMISMRNIRHFEIQDQKILTQTKIEILSKALKEFMFKNRYLTDKVEKLIMSLLEKQYQSSYEIENKLEQILFQIQQQIQITPLSFQQSQSDPMEIEKKPQNEINNKHQFKITSNLELNKGYRNKNLKKEQNITCAINNHNENTVTNLAKLKKEQIRYFKKLFRIYPTQSGKIIENNSLIQIQILREIIKIAAKKIKTIQNIKRWCTNEVLHRLTKSNGNS